MQGGWQWWGWVQALGPAPLGGLCPKPLPSVSSLRGEVRGLLGNLSGLSVSPICSEAEVCQLLPHTEASGAWSVLRPSPPPPCLQRQVEVNVRNKILYLIQAWAHAFRNEPKYKVVQDTYQIMKVEGESGLRLGPG